MANVIVKETDQKTVIIESSESTISLPEDRSSWIEMDLQGKSIEQEYRDGNDLILELSNGQQLVFEGFFTDDNDKHEHMLFVETAGGLVALDVAGAVLVPETASLIVSADASSSLGSGAVASAGTLAVGVGALAGTSGSSSSPTSEMTPPAPTVSIITADTVSGYGEPGATVSVFYPGIEDAISTTVDSQGYWQLSFPDPVAEGTELTVDQQIDGVSSATITTVVDLTPPAAPAVHPSSGNTLEGTGEPGATVTINVPGMTEILTAVVDENGTWQVAFPHAVPHNSEVSVTLTDSAGNTSERTLIQVDSEAPTTPAVDPTDGSQLGGTGEPGATMTVTIAGVATALTTTVDAEGNWQLTLPEALPNGTEITTTQVDAAGNTSVAHSSTVASAPLQIDSLATGADTAIQGTGNPGDELVLRDASGDLIATLTVGEDGNWSYSPDTPFEDGATITAHQVNDAGEALEVEAEIALDFDADGVRNTQDIDDDNDGILDTQEVRTALGDYANLTASPDQPALRFDHQNGFPDTLESNSAPEEITGSSAISFGSGLGAYHYYNDVRFSAAAGTQPTVEAALENASYIDLALTASDNPDRELALELGNLQLVNGSENTVRVVFYGDSGDNVTHWDGFMFALARADYTTVLDEDGDGIHNALDSDSDNGGVNDNIEAQYANVYTAPSGTDVDSDGLDDAYDSNTSGAAGSVGLTPADSDGDGVGDWLITANDIDTPPLSLSSLAVGVSTELSGTGVPGATVTLTAGDQILGSATVDASGSWQIEPEVSFDDGAEITATQSDIPHFADSASPDITSAVTAEVRYDTDGDGVVNSIDIDDDNDGILDSLEMTAPLLPEQLSTLDNTNYLNNGFQAIGASFFLTGSSVEGRLSSSIPIRKVR